MAVILVTGSSTGIGQETAIQLAQRGHKVYAACRNPSGADELNQRITEIEGDISTVAIDLLDHSTIDSAVAHIVKAEGQIDVLVSNAGIGGGRAMEETPMEEVREVYETNVFGTLAVMQAVIPHFRKQRSGRLINVTSLGAVNIFGCLDRVENGQSR